MQSIYIFFQNATNPSFFFKALILKTEHKQTLQSVAVLNCIERILIDREDILHLG